MGGLITGGLGAPAHHGLITTKFHLGGFFAVTIIVNPDGGVGITGGSVPIAPGKSAQMLQRPVHYKAPNTTQSATPQYYVPYKPATPMQQVVIKVQLGDNNYEKNYLVPGFVPNVILKTSDIINKTKNIATFIVKALRLTNKTTVTLDKYNKTK